MSNGQWILWKNRYILQKPPFQIQIAFDQLSSDPWFLLNTPASNWASPLCYYQDPPFVIQLSIGIIGFCHWNSTRDEKVVMIKLCSWWMVIEIVIVFLWWEGCFDHIVFLMDGWILMSTSMRPKFSLILDTWFNVNINILYIHGTSMWPQCSRQRWFVFGRAGPTVE